MDAFQFIWAISASFYGLLGIWAAVVRRHWFLRFLTIGGLLLSALLIPAYELVIPFALQIVVIVVGLWLARAEQGWPTRMSLETALLAMVVVAVVAAVLGRMPTLQLFNWVEGATVGLGTGMAVLMALWVVCGRGPLWRRAVAGALAGIFWIALFHFGMTLAPSLYPNAASGTFVAQYARENLVRWLQWWLPVFGLTAVILCGAIWLGRTSGWFTEEETPAGQPAPRRQKMARIGLCIAFAITLLPMAYLGYRLLALEPWPSVELPKPNGLDDFIAAGEMTPVGLIDPGKASPAISDAQLEAEVQRLQPALLRISLGLSRESYVDARLSETSPEAYLRIRMELRDAERAMLVKLAHVMRTGTLTERIEAALQHEQFVQQAYRGTGLRWTQYWPCSQSRGWVRGDLRTLLKEADHQLCRSTARRLYELDASAEPLHKRTDTQWLIDAHENWQQHLQNILMRWSGRDPFDWMIQRERRDIVDLKILAVQFALRGFYLQHQRLPAELAELAPDYLPSVPSDPFSDGTLKMRLTPDAVLIYGLGEDGDDDGGIDHPLDSRGFIDMSEGDHVRGIVPAELGVSP